MQSENSSNSSQTDASASAPGGVARGEVLIQVQSTPNPRAKMFWLSVPVCLNGSVNISRQEMHQWDVRLVSDLFLIPEIYQVHLRHNTLTISINEAQAWDDLIPEIVSIIRTRIPVHDPLFWQKKKAKPTSLSPEVARVDELLEQHIRSYLRIDGGDLEVVDVQDHRVYIRYHGACGHCPSSYQGTLQAIEGILQQHWRSDAEVIPVD